MKRLSLVLGALLAISLTTGCATNPATGGTDLVLMSEKEEIKIGTEMHEELIKGGAAYPDPEVQAYVNRIGQKLAKVSDRPDLEYTFTVIDDENINAFATPGGFVYINRGLMMYLDNEAELAGVLGHEIGHITARHSVRQQTAGMTNSVLAGAAYILTGSADVADASNYYGTSLVRGYGREHELEADSEGAAYMHRAGYDPNQLLEVIGVLKDQERYSRTKAKEAGKRPQTYHGLFSTHPRNDKRLQQVVRTAAELEDRPPKEIDPREFMAAIDGMTYGKSSARTQREDDRFYHNKLLFTFAFPEQWSVKSGSKAITAKADDASAGMNITIKRSDQAVSDRDRLGEQLGVSKLLQSEPLEQAGLKGHTGIAAADASKGERRVAIINYRGISYFFEAETASSADFEGMDPVFLEMIESFRPMQNTERQSGKPTQLRYIQADGNTSLAEYARRARVKDAENQLRLMNGYYPQGEPRRGEWIKIIEYRPEAEG